MMRHSSILVAFLIGGIAALAVAQTTPDLESLTVEDGLSQGFINGLLQDKEGFLWIATRNGLNRYDGKEVKVFMHDPLNPFSISGNSMNSIYESGDFILVLANDNLNIFYKKTQQFFKIKSKVKFAQRFIGRLYFDQENQIWGLSKKRNGQFIINRIDWIRNLKSDKIEQSPIWPIRGIQSWTIEGDRVFIRGQTVDFIWGNSDNNIFSISKTDGAVKYYQTPYPVDYNGWLNTSDNTLWFKADHATGKITGSKIEWMDKGALDRQLADFLGWEASMPLGLDLLKTFNLPDYKIKSMTAFPGKPSRIPGFGKKGVSAILIDRSGILWVGTNGFGVLKYTPRLHRFERYFPNAAIQTDVLLDGAGHFGVLLNNGTNWLLSSPKLIYRSAIDTRREFRPQGHLSSTGQHWLMTTDKNQILVRRNNGQGKQWTIACKIPFAEDNNYISTTDSIGNLWFVYQNKLYRIKSADLNIDTFDFALGRDRPGRFTCIAQTAGGSWWIGAKNGLLQAVPDGEKFAFRFFKKTTDGYQGIQGRHVTSLLKDPKQPHILWIGTLSNGLSRLDTRTRKFTHYNTRNGFPDNIIYGILADDAGRLWMSSNKGLIQFNPQTGDVKNFTVKDGLPTNEFNNWAFAKRSDGTLFFGCLKGLIVFNPNNFSDNPVTPQVCLTGLEINNAPVVFGDSSGVLKQTIGYTQKLTLPYSQNSITLQFAALEYTIPSANRYRYYLKGAEPEWAHTTFENRASYLNLSPGKYTFLVKASNSDGVWHIKPTALEITILPPWYRTALAYGIYSFLFLALLYGVMRFFLHRQRLQYKLEMEQREAERLKDLDAFKSRVFTNITHEFRTPLTVITGMAGEVKAFEPGKPLARLEQAGEIIERNGADLLRLINQLLDLAKLEAKSLTLHPVQFDLLAFVKYLAGSFESLAATKRIRLQVNSNLETVQVAMDKDQLQTIFSNLLSNAIKFTPENGNIDLEITYSGTWQNFLDKDFHFVAFPAQGHDDGWVIIQVRDNGIGISSDQLPNVFEHFYQINNTESRQGKGSGIGLALVKELVILMEGALAVKSQTGEGATFLVVLPVQSSNALSGTVKTDDETVAGVYEHSGKASTPNLTNEKAPDNEEDQPNLLIIEDNADVLHYLRVCVEDAYRIQTAANGQQGIDLALETVPDIIICDVMMPLKDGFEVVSTLKNDERTSHIPIILLTARADLESRIEGIERGADAYLAKPFDKTQLLVQLRKLLELRRKLQARYAAGIPANGGQPNASREIYLEDVFIQKAQAALEVHMQDENFDVPGLCKAMNMSRTQLHRKMKALTGKSATHFIRSVRLHKARQLLLTTDMTVSEAAFEVGFRHLQHFSTSFAEEFGQPPSSLKK
ncbi:MAG: helix-turn-helix domain-containing protein [Lewinellaceae bacterium]|nr:helix-turn-helix domain-containing protein [Lewinellaceae bacterium]